MTIKSIFCCESTQFVSEFTPTLKFWCQIDVFYHFFVKKNFYSYFVFKCDPYRNSIHIIETTFSFDHLEKKFFKFFRAFLFFASFLQKMTQKIKKRAHDANPIRNRARFCQLFHAKYALSFFLPRPWMIKKKKVVSIVWMEYAILTQVSKKYL